jgi:VIT1/CCC1 family predicted Fe2+/Mn2+ transporter
MDISSPYFVVSVIVVVFVVAILFATGTREDGPPTH